MIICKKLTGRFFFVELRSRETKKRAGFAEWYGKDDRGKIVLNRIGWNVGTLLHELAHLSKHIDNHGEAFKRTQLSLQTAYFRAFRKEHLVAAGISH